MYLEQGLVDDCVHLYRKRREQLLVARQERDANRQTPGPEEQPLRLSPTFWAARRLIRVLGSKGQARSYAARVGAALASEFSQDWPGERGAEDAEMEIKVAIEKYDPAKDRILTAADWAIQRDESERPRCLEPIGLEVARLVFLMGVYIASQDGGSRFAMAERAVADALGFSTHVRVNRAIVGELRPARLVFKVQKEKRWVRAAEYELFTSPEAILAGAVPEAVDDSAEEPAPELVASVAGGEEVFDDCEVPF